MTIKTILLSFLMCASVFVKAQQNTAIDQSKSRRCSTLEPTSAQRKMQNAFKRKHKQQRSSSNKKYRIPVVFHVMNLAGASRSQVSCRISDALNTMNIDFQGLDPWFNNIDPRFNNIKETMDLEFCLARKDPSGNILTDPGIDWQENQTNVSHGADSDLFNYKWYGVNGKYYLDIYLLRSTWTVYDTWSSGWANFPETSTGPTIVYNVANLGATCGSKGWRAWDKTISHEAGHVFGLYHTFGSGTCSGNDQISDTPPTTINFGCDQNRLNDCGVYPNTQNLMSYNSNCVAMFTKGQVTRMKNVLDDVNFYHSPRGLLHTESNLVAVGAVASVSAINSNALNLCAGTSIIENTHNTTNATGIGSATGLPTGLTANWSSNTITISGTPTQSGTYNYSIPVLGAGCGDSMVAATGSISVTSGTSCCTYQTINFNNFESGWGIWNDGGSDSRRSSNDASYALGTYCARLRDNTSTSVITTDNLDLSNYEEITIDFSYYARSMDNSNEDFWLQISTNGGSSYTTVEEWNRGDEFNNNERNYDQVVLSGPFTSNTRLRFRCDASGNKDWVYIDDITISGCVSVASRNSMGSAQNAILQDNQISIEQQDQNSFEISVYPNPARDFITVKLIGSNFKIDLIRIIDLNGRIAHELQGSGVDNGVYSINIGNLKSGIYFVSTVIKETNKVINKKIIVQ